MQLILFLTLYESVEINMKKNVLNEKKIVEEKNIFDTIEENVDLS